jgi:tetratricopeptide (TPR) repeat protein
MSIHRFVAASVVAILVFAAVPVYAQQSARDDENLIRGLLRDKLYEVAADKIFDFVFKYPQHPRRESMLFDICTTLVEMGKETKAVPLLRCYLQEFPQGQHLRQVTMMLARSEAAGGENAKAIELLRKIISDSAFSAADQTAAREILAGIYLRQFRFDGAATLIEGAPERRVSADGRLLLARALRGQGRREEAEVVLRSLVSESRHGEAWQRARAELATLYVEMARYQDCQALLQDWTPPTSGSINELNRQLLLALASSHYHLGDYETAYRALAPLTSAAGAAATAGPSQRELISIMLSLNEWSSASELIAPLYAGARDSILKENLGLMLADAYTGSGRFPDAIAVLGELAEMSSDPGRKVDLLMRAAGVSSNSEARLALLDKALQAGPSGKLMVDLQFARAAVLERTGKKTEAIDALMKIVELGEGTSGGAAEALLRVGDINLNNGELEQAERVFTGVAERPSIMATRRAALERLVRVRMLLREWGRSTEAFGILRSTANEEEISGQAWFDGAAALAALGKHEESARAAQRAYLSDPELPERGAERAMMLMADESYRAGGLDLAESIYSEMLQSGESNIRVAAAAGYIQCAISAGRLEEAVERCRALAESSENTWLSGWARLTMARVYESLGDLESKKKTLTAIALELQGSTFADAAYQELRKMALDAGAYSAAANYDPLFASINPQKQYEADRLLLRARKLVLEKNYEQAARLYRAYPEALIMPDHDRFLCAIAFHETGDHAGALNLMLSVDGDRLQVPQRRERDLVIAEAMVAVGKPDDALAIFRALLAEALPQVMRLDTVFGAARASEAAGRWADANNYYHDYLERSKDLEPDLQRMEKIAEAFAAHGELADAAELYRQLKILASDTNQLVAYSYKAAMMLADGGELELAAEEFLKIAYQHPDMDPWPARSRLRAGAIYERLERLDAAERQYRVVAEKYPESEEGKAAAQRLRAISERREAIKEEQLKAQPPHQR